MSESSPSTAGIDSPVVSVVMPVYNAGQYLAASIDSMLAQSYADFEFIVVDDASTDGSAEVLAKYTDPRLTVVRNDGNRGVSASRNRGVKMARGEFVAQMDQDDIAYPRRLEEQVKFLRRHPDIGMCGCQVIRFLGQHRHRLHHPMEHEDIRATLLFHSSFQHSTVMARRQLLFDHELFYDESLHHLEDFDLWSRLVEKIRVANLDKVLLDYRCHPGQLSSDYSKKFYDVLDVLYRKTVTRLIPDMTDDELRMHRQVSLPGDQLDTDELRRMAHWLHRLAAANHDGRFYDKDALAETLGRQWLTLCRQSAQKDLGAFMFFWREPISRPVRYSLKSARLLARSLLRR